MFQVAFVLFRAQMESNSAAGALHNADADAGSQLLYRVLRVSENVTRVYKQRDDVWRFYITLVSAVTDDIPGTALSLLNGNEAEQRRICVAVTRRSEVEALTVQSHYRMDSREVVTFPENHLTSRRTSSSTAEHSASHDSRLPTTVEIDLASMSAGPSKKPMQRQCT